jgi:hypothetical protein
VAVEQADAERVLEVGYGFRNHRLRDGEAIRGPHHASGLSDREENVKFAQFDTTADAVRPLHWLPP